MNFLPSDDIIFHSISAQELNAQESDLFDALEEKICSLFNLLPNHEYQLQAKELDQIYHCLLFDKQILTSHSKPDSLLLHPACFLAQITPQKEHATRFFLVLYWASELEINLIGYQNNTLIYFQNLKNRPNIQDFLAEIERFGPMDLFVCSLDASLQAQTQNYYALAKAKVPNLFLIDPLSHHPNLKPYDLSTNKQPPLLHLKRIGLFLAAGIVLGLICPAILFLLNLANQKELASLHQAMQNIQSNRDEAIKQNHLKEEKIIALTKELDNLTQALNQSRPLDDFGRFLSSYQQLSQILSPYHSSIAFLHYQQTKLELLLKGKQTSNLLASLHHHPSFKKVLSSKISEYYFVEIEL